MLHHHGSTDATQEQVVVCVVAGILERDVLEQTAVHNQKAVYLGLHLPASAEHASGELFSLLKLSPQEEMSNNFFKTCGGEAATMICNVTYPPFLKGPH